MPTGDCNLAMFDFVMAESAYGVAGEVHREAEIVKRVDVTLGSRREFGKAIHVGHRRDRQPVFAKFV